MSSKEHFDIAIIGGGIAGLSFAAEAAKSASVILLEAEPHLSYHATGRSAAYFAPAYGNSVIRQLTLASAATYQTADGTFTAEVLSPRPSLFVGRPRQQDAIDTMMLDQPGLKRLNNSGIRDLVPIINETIQDGLLDTSGGDLDVDLIVQGYARQARQRDAQIVSTNRVMELRYQDGWQLTTDKADTYRASVVVNAAGAWSDHIATLAGLTGLGLTPLKRTAILVDPPQDLDIRDWPITVDIDEAFYFKPEAGKLLISPADETPYAASDAQPDEMDIATAVDRVCQVTSLQVTRISHKWAGLRTFAADRSPVIGFDPRVKGFFWLSGQGGYGVQTAPGVARLACQICFGETLDKHFQPLKNLVSPDRLVSN